MSLGVMELDGKCLSLEELTSEERARFDELVVDGDVLIHLEAYYSDPNGDLDDNSNVHDTYSVAYYANRKVPKRLFRRSIGIPGVRIPGRDLFIDRKRLCDFLDSRHKEWFAIKVPHLFPTLHPHGPRHEWYLFAGNNYDVLGTDENLR